MTCMHKTYAQKKSSPYRKENRDDAFCEEFKNASEWDVMRKVCFITTVFIILHWPINQHAMRSSANDVNYHREKQEIRNRGVQN